MSDSEEKKKKLRLHRLDSCLLHHIFEFLTRKEKSHLILLSMEDGEQELIKKLLIPANLMNFSLYRYRFQSTPLISACAKGYLNFVKLFINEGAELEAKNRCGESALIQACRENQLLIVQYLISHGASINVKNHKGCTALDVAQSPEIRKILIEEEGH